MAIHAYELKARIERDELLLKLCSEQGKLIATIDLAKKLRLSDDEARELLTKLDERERQKAEEAH